ncbi:winged helix DNA-binding protein [Alkalinema sp. FACHB-956]|uniref:MarR family winged helix-turn-helix transcriptional regulator n=1 Tax=Alkalinema sp. FACHB-956 TaxID=2692768 RepID=UPI0016883686|nr:winged helix DNA-binding protein [Alkalinema sp. FACHB-956]MBD2326322.1 winged helix DNA-binding protein [Alkalinema sp. FACHB-956]
MADSQSLRLLSAAAKFHHQLTEYVAEQLYSAGFEGVSPSMLHFLSVLDGGVSYGAEISRQLQVSRQMVAKTIKELCQAGYLEQGDGIGRQKQILLTDKGERLMAMARSILADLDRGFTDRCGEVQIEEMTTQLEMLKETFSIGQERG